MNEPDQYLAALAKQKDIFRGGAPALFEDRLEIYKDSFHEHTVWSGPTFEKPVLFHGFESMVLFNEYLLSMIPKFTLKVIKLHRTPDASTCIIEMKGGGDVRGGGTYRQNYLSIIRVRDGKAQFLKEYCNPFETYRAFGKEQWEANIERIAKSNVPVPTELSSSVA